MEIIALKKEENNVNILTPNKGTGRQRKKTMFKHE
jgi:hypothetical protein